MSEFIGTKLTMNLGERSYDIIIKSGSLENLYQFARLDRRVAVVTDSGVPAQYAQRVADQCKDARIITVPQGEASMRYFRGIILFSDTYFPSVSFILPERKP